MDEEQRRLKQAQKKRTIERNRERHFKRRVRDLFHLYRNKRAEIFLTNRPYMDWIKLWNRHNYNVDDYWTFHEPQTF
jgi:hypothetical protein